MSAGEGSGQKNLAGGGRGSLAEGGGHHTPVPLRSMAYVLHQSGSPHSHGLDPGGYERLGESPCGPQLPTPSNTSVRAAFVHVVGDLLQSVGVFVAATIIYFKVRARRATVGGVGVGSLGWLWPKPPAASTCFPPALCSPSTRLRIRSAPSSSPSSCWAPP